MSGIPVLFSLPFFAFNYSIYPPHTARDIYDIIQMA